MQFKEDILRLVFDFVSFVGSVATSGSAADLGVGSHVRILSKVFIGNNFVSSENNEKNKQFQNFSLKLFVYHEGLSSYSSVILWISNEDLSSYFSVFLKIKPMRNKDIIRHDFIDILFLKTHIFIPRVPW